MGSVVLSPVVLNAFTTNAFRIHIAIRGKQFSSRVRRVLCRSVLPADVEVLN